MFDKLGSITNALKNPIAAATEWIGTTVGGKIGGPTGATVGQKIGKAVGGLFEKKPGASEPFRPIDTSVQALSLGSYSMRTQAMGDAQSPSMRMKTVDGETLNAEWEYRLTKGLRNRNLYT